MTDRQFSKAASDLVHYVDAEGSVVVFNGTSYFYQDDTERKPLESFDPAQHAEVGRLRSHRCAPGDYPWDHWQAWALEDGVPSDLANLGRSLIREADQHNWDAGLCDECGWHDNGAAMIELAIEDPQSARRRWEYLLETDGQRVPYKGPHP